MIETDVALQLKETHQKVVQIMQSKIDEYGLTFGLLHLMILIEKKPNANQKDLAKDMRFTQGAMSVVVKRLLKLDMIKQIPLESDMRFNRLVLTEKGKSMIDDYREHILKKYENMFKGFNNSELIELHDFLLRINQNLDNINSTNSLSNLEE
ncbi:MarR family winged helix-turn-helix transcriptional regulator [Wansuia hejianensis]|uniref:MarR family transcriptional regulator n=1 Tax=Wansuia hejianensis TaxID=2763667 RepID=A0A926EW18_9FIRM|nr:MarR family transcriptional regulator [Wansuia hejianensis]MBC8590928.1 MarR family transcriptional regulator [Wansuia hejianensis]